MVKIFKKILLLLVLVASFPLLTSMNYSLEDLILTEKDWELEKSQISPAITNPDESFESYNHWQCFPMEYVKFECDYTCGKFSLDHCALEDTFWIPDVNIDTENKEFHIGYDLELFRTSAMESWQNCQKFINEWRVRFQNEIGICTYSAALPIDEPSIDIDIRSLWRIKSLHNEMILFDDSDIK